MARQPRHIAQWGQRPQRPLYLFRSLRAFSTGDSTQSRLIDSVSHIPYGNRQSAARGKGTVGEERQARHSCRTPPKRNVSAVLIIMGVDECGYGVPGADFQTITTSRKEGFVEALYAFCREHGLGQLFSPAPGHEPGKAETLDAEAAAECDKVHKMLGIEPGDCGIQTHPYACRQQVLDPGYGCPECPGSPDGIVDRLRGPPCSPAHLPQDRPTPRSLRVYEGAVREEVCLPPEGRK